MNIMHPIPLVLLVLAQTSQATANKDELTQWESYQAGEEEVVNQLSDEIISQIKKEYQGKNQRTFRQTHPRGIGCVSAKFIVDPKLAAEYQTGVFNVPGKSYDAIIRFSSALGPQGDNMPDMRGMAIKLLGVPGTKMLQGQENAQTQDFLLNNSPTFVTKNAQDFAGLVSIQGDQTKLSKFLSEDTISHLLELKTLLDTTLYNPYNGKSLLETQFYSQVPFLLKGSDVNSPIKYISRPCGAVTNRKLDGTGFELRNDLQTRIQEQDACFEFAVQFYKENEGFSVENGMSAWDEAKSPFIKFATIKIPRQVFMTDEKLNYCDNLSYHPWHSLEAHRPLGNINRTRKKVYENISKFRHDRNQESAKKTEPSNLAIWNSFQSKVYDNWKAIKVPANSK